jgi:anti-anti-sigma factor
VPDRFRCEIQPERARVRVRFLGELDIAGVRPARAAVAELIAAGFESVLIDLSGLEFIDSSGLHLLHELAGEAQRDGIAFALVPGPAAVQRIFTLTGMETRLPFLRAARRPLPRPLWVSGSAAVK